MVLLEARVEGAVFVDPQGLVGEAAGRANHVGIEAPAEHVADRLGWIRPADGMVDHVELVNEWPRLGRDQPQVAQQPLAEAGIALLVTAGERAPHAGHHVVAPDPQVAVVAPRRRRLGPLPAAVVVAPGERRLQHAGLQVVLEDDPAEVTIDGVAIPFPAGVAGLEELGLDRAAEQKLVPPQPGPNLGPAERLTAGVDQPHGMLPHPVLLDSGKRLPPPGSVGRAALVMNVGMGEVREFHRAAVVDHPQVGDLQLLRPFPQLKDEHGLAGDRLHARQKWHVDPSPVAVGGEAPHAKFRAARDLVFNRDDPAGSAARRRPRAAGPQRDQHGIARRHRLLDRDRELHRPEPRPGPGDVDRPAGRRTAVVGRPRAERSGRQAALRAEDSLRQGIGGDHGVAAIGRWGSGCGHGREQPRQQEAGDPLPRSRDALDFWVSHGDGLACQCIRRYRSTAWCRE